jgi:hypothetical protein
MNDFFIVKLVLSFIVGGLYTIAATVTADKLGPKIGGIISGLPSTVLFGLVFIGWTQTPQSSFEATTLLPAVIGLACLFLITFIYFVKQNIWLALCAAFIVWSIPAFGLINAGLHDFFIALLIFCVLFCIAHIFVTRIFTIKASKGNKIVYTPRILVVRGLISGSIVALSVIIAKVSGPVLGGMISAFPAMFSSTLIITYFAHGPAFSSAVAKSSLFAWISTLIFVIAARYTFLTFGIIGGSIIALIACYISAYFLYTIVVKKHA